MNIHQLEIFSTVYKTRSMAKAAEQLAVAQPAISRCICELEKEHNALFFQRTGRSLIPTNDGKRFYEYVIQILDLLHSLKEEYSNSYEVRIGCTSTIGSFFVPKIIEEMHSSFPDIHISLLVDSQDTINSNLKDKTIDLALLEEGFSYMENYKYTGIGGDNLCAIIPPNHALSHKEITLEELSQYFFVVKVKGSAGRKHIENIFANHGSELKITAECSSAIAILNCVHHGMGFALLPEAHVKEYISYGYISKCIVVNDEMKRNFFLVHEKEKQLSNPVIKVLEYIKDNFPSDD